MDVGADERMLIQREGGFRYAERAGLHRRAY